MKNNYSDSLPKLMISEWDFEKGFSIFFKWIRLVCIAGTTLSPPPFGEGLCCFVRVRLFVCMYPVVAPKMLVEKWRSVHEIGVKLSPDDNWEAANLVSRRHFESFKKVWLNNQSCRPHHWCRDFLRYEPAHLLSLNVFLLTSTFLNNS